MGNKIDKKITKQVRIDTGMHTILKIEAARQGESLKVLLERYLAEGLDRDNASLV